MVNLRYHIVSLTAVFLALGLGILAGTTVIDQQVVSGLRANTAALRNDLDRANGRIDDLERQISVSDRFGDAIEPALLEGRLAGRAVVILQDRRVSGDLVSELTEALTLANAKRPTRLTLTDKWALRNASDMQQLGQTLGSNATSAPEVLEAAATRIGSRLGASANPRAEGDLIKTLTDTDFLDVADLPPSGAFPSANALVIVLSSGDPEEVPTIDGFFLSMVKALSTSRIVAVAEPSTAEGGRSLARMVRDDRDLARTVSTIDHADTVPGRLSIVYALRALGAGEPAVHYGFRDGATIAPNVRPA